MKIVVYAICKNEAKFVARFCEAAKDADEIVVCDTGSTDDTVALLKEHGATVHNIRISPWRFDDARNAALAMLATDADVCVSLDLDEVLQPGWREDIERVWTPQTTRLRYMFDWGCGIAFYYEKIHARYGYRWHHPCHEYPVPDRISEVWAQTDTLLVVHQPDPTKSRGQYLDLLRISIEEDPNCPRNAFYYARELSFHNRWHEAIAQAERYLALPRATWANERCYAMRVISRSYSELGDIAQAMTWARRATSEAPNTREPWCELSMLCYRSRRWAECFGAALTALDITDRAKVYTVDPAVWGFQPHDLAAISAWNMGLKDVAAKYAKQAFDLAPEDPRLKANLEFMQVKPSANDAAGLLQDLAIAYKDLRKSKVFAIVPTKSNFEGAKKTVESLLSDPAIVNVAVICETSEAKASIVSSFPSEIGSRVVPICTAEGLGIQHMWNKGLDSSCADSHILFINDDTTIDGIGASAMAGFLDHNPDVGLICPNYDKRASSGTLVETRETCGGRYDGAGGMGGFCMMLSSDFAKEWKFDERMIWWYGDDDLLNHVWGRGKRAGIFTPSSCSGNESWTINNDPPKDFARIRESDRLVFEEKWIRKASNG